MKKTTIFWTLLAGIGVLLCMRYIPSDLLRRMTEPCTHCSCTRHLQKKNTPQEPPEQA